MSTPVKVLIVEDEMIVAAKISLHLEEMGYEVVGILPRGEEAVLHCRQSPPDLLLLDINLKGVLDGVETAKLLRKEMTKELPIIYLTANSDEKTYERARETFPRAFLSKPYTQQDLARAIDLAIIQNPKPGINRHLLPNVNSDEEETYLLSDRIFVRHNKRMVKVYLKDILHITAERAYCRIITVDTEYLLSIALGKLEDQLRAGNFLRVHRSHLVNLNQVDEVAERHLVIGGTAIPIGKSFNEELSQRLQLIHS